MASLYGAVRLTGGDHEFNLVLAKNPGLELIVKAESPYDRPAQESRLSTSTRKVKPGRLLRQVAPEYPATAKIPGMGASVQIAGLIRTNGTFDNIVVLSAPSPDLALATLLAVRQWRYSPTYVNGKAVEVVTITDVRFHIR
jgi:outer membrane biosynthesis protein TonB